MRRTCLLSSAAVSHFLYVFIDYILFNPCLLVLHQLKQPRILNLLADARLEDADVKSEAAFQRLVASCSELPAQPRTPRTFTDRGRYPEEAVREENAQESPSDDESEDGEGQFAFSATSGTQPINIQKSHTPAGSITGSFNGDDLNMSISETSSSFGAAAMDIDVVSLKFALLLAILFMD